MSDDFLPIYTKVKTAYDYHKFKEKKEIENKTDHEYNNNDFLKKFKKLKKKLEKNNIYVYYLKWNKSVEHFLEELKNNIEIQILLEYKKSDVSYIFTTENYFYYANTNGKLLLSGKSINEKDNIIMYNELKKIFKNNFTETIEEFNINDICYINFIKK